MPKHPKTKRIPKTEEIAKSPPPFKKVSASVSVSEEYEAISQIEEGQYVIEEHDMPYLKTKANHNMYRFFRLYTPEELSNPHAKIIPHPGLRGAYLFGNGK